MYGKIFEQMYHGTLAAGPWEALVTFQQMIVIADRFGIVDMTADAISRKTTIPVAIIQKGITALEQPDPESRSPDEEGRRIARLTDGRAWGWRIVNHEYYRKLRSEEERRDYHRQYYRDNRSKAARELSTKTQHHSNGSTHSTKAVSSKQYAVSSKHKNPTAASRPVEPPEFLELRQVFPKRSGSQPWRRALAAAKARIREGHSWQEILDGARRYAVYIRAIGKEHTEYVKQAATFCGTDKHFLEPWNLPKTKADNRMAGNLDAAQEFKRRVAT